MKQPAFFVVIIIAVNMLSAPTHLFAQSTASETTLNADTIESAINELEKKVNSATTTQERLEASELLAPLQEQMGMYAEAGRSYTYGASLAGVQTLRGQTLLLGSVRCALSVGDIATADFLLSTTFGFATDETIRATTKLYAIWSWIIKAETEAELAGPISVIKSYIPQSDMIRVKPALLLTLYHLTNEKAWGEQLQKEFPNSPEAAIILGQAHILPAPFWFFITNRE